MEPYEDLGLAGSVSVWGCLNCGALVYNKDRHNEHHELQAGVASDARHGRAGYDHLRATP